MDKGVSVGVDDVGDKIQGFFKLLEDIALHSGDHGEFCSVVAVPQG